jgi:post-segregation antitoxin (ccd killing protein)
MIKIKELREAALEAALNEARKGKWTDDDKHASWNATAKFAPAQGLVAAKGNIKLDVTYGTLLIQVKII